MVALELIEKNKKKILNLAVLFVALFIAFKIYSNQAQELSSLDQKKDTETEKNVVLQKIDKINKEVESYRKFINNKEISNIINAISDIAKSSSVEIVSVKPEAEEAKNYYTKHLFNLRLLSASYHNIGDFISRLESAPDIFNVETINMSQQVKQTAERRSEQVGVDLRISTILAK
jgi:Tfp pilus assembly protein PilO